MENYLTTAREARGASEALLVKVSVLHDPLSKVCREIYDVKYHTALYIIYHGINQKPIEMSLCRTFVAGIQKHMHARCPKRVSKRTHTRIRVNNHAYRYFLLVIDRLRKIYAYPT